MSKEEDFGDEGARPSSLIPVHRPAVRDPLHDLQLLRDVAIISEQVRRKLGPPAAASGGVSDKQKESDKENNVKLHQLAAFAAVSSVGAASAYGTSESMPESLTVPPAVREFVGSMGRSL